MNISLLLMNLANLSLRKSNWQCFTSNPHQRKRPEVPWR